MLNLIDKLKTDCRTDLRNDSRTSALKLKQKF